MSQRDDFLNLVSALTGVSTRIVGQANDAAAYLDQFTRAADKVAGQGATAALILVFANALTKMQPDTAAQDLLAGNWDRSSPDPRWPYSAMAKCLMKFVLLGLWVDPTAPQPNEGIIPTAASYSESLVWLIAQAHPVGASKMSYGHWAGPPPSLKSLIG
jgi:hypothetical protein